MHKLQFISAGAGSGKTYTLTRILSKTLQNEAARPSGVIATTFTVKAATELRERVRGHLFDEGLFSLGNAMGQARIGTVNSVCGGLLERFAFEKGLSPALQIIDEEQSKILIQKTLDSVLPGKAFDSLLAHARRLDIQDWKADLSKLVKEVRGNCIDIKSLPEMASQNADALLEKFGNPDTDNPTVRLKAKIATALQELKPHLVTTPIIKKTINYHQFLLNFQRDLMSGRVPWSQWVKLSKERPGAAAITPAVQEIAQISARCFAHPRLHEDVREYLKLLFQAGALIIESYQDRKKELGVIDFTDQEALFLDMLDHSEVVDTLSDELDLLLVDEFQDTSPIQLALFLKLSKLAKQTYFVGDIKQAIYGFRGSSPELMQDLLKVFPTIGGEVEILGNSWRSRPPLVHLANGIFTRAFSETLSEQEVALVPQRTECVENHAFAHWTLEGANVGDRARALAGGVRDLVNSKYILPDESGSKKRPVRYKDIAILTRSNDGATAVAQSLRNAGIPVSTGGAGLLKTPESCLALACLKRLIDKNDTLATAEIISLADCAEPESWLSDRLRFLEKDASTPNEWLETGQDAHPVLARIAQLRNRLAVLTIQETLRLLVAECDLAGTVMQWCKDSGSARVKLANLEALIDFAGQYQQICRSLHEPATVSGFLVWLQDLEEAKEDEPATPALDAVTVMTCHRAKGLEWPVVILTELESNVRNGLWSISTFSSDGFSAENPLDGRTIHYWPWPFGKQSKGIEVMPIIEASREYKSSMTGAVEEAKRLLYVAMTRARDLLVLAHNPKARPSTTPWLDTLKADWLLPAQENSAASIVKTPQGEKVPCKLQSQSVEADNQAESSEPEPLFWFKTSTERSYHPPRTISPSEAPGTSDTYIERQEKVGRPMQVLSTKSDWSLVGNSLHACFAASFTDSAAPISEEECSEILKEYGVEDTILASEVRTQAEALHAWVKKNWPHGTVRAEVPIRCRNEQGQIVKGEIDLLIETPEGFVIVDHKSSRVGKGGVEEIASKHSGQLGLYKNSIKRISQKDILRECIFLPLSGKIISLKSATSAMSTQPEMAMSRT